MSDKSPTQPTRRPGTIGTSDRFKDAAGRLWKLTRKGWRKKKARTANVKRT
jgi:hypothetical protein